MLLLIDNFDSFTYNIAHAFINLGIEVKIIRPDTDFESAFDPFPDYLVIGPGPGHPCNACLSQTVLQEALGKIPVLGICLGHQLIGTFFGGSIVRAIRPCHGKVDQILHQKKGIFATLPSPFLATRYHSLVIEPNSLSHECEILATTNEGEVMAIAHRTLPVAGVQFHPESIASEHGQTLLGNFLFSNSSA